MTKRALTTVVGCVCSLGLLLGVYQANAANKMGAPNKAPVPPASERGNKPGQPPAGDPQAEAQRCERMKKVLDSREESLQNQQGEKARYDNEYTTAQARIKELEQLRAQLDAQIKRLQDRMNREKNNWNQKCGNMQTCTTYDKYVDDLETRMKPVEDEMKALQDRMNATTAAIAQLEQRIPPLQQEYNKNNCSNLVPGETAQETIDLCARVFSDWNRAQGELNKLKPQVQELQEHYADHYQQLKGLQQPLDEYSTYMAKNCSTSQKVTTINQMRTRRGDYDRMGTSINDVAARFKKLKDVRITVETK